MLDEIVWNYGFVSKVSFLMSSRIKWSIKGLWGNTASIKSNSTVNLTQTVLLHLIHRDPTLVEASLAIFTHQLRKMLRESSWDII